MKPAEVAPVQGKSTTTCRTRPAPATSAPACRNLTKPRAEGRVRETVVPRGLVGWVGGRTCGTLVSTRNAIGRDAGAQNRGLRRQGQSIGRPTPAFPNGVGLVDTWMPGGQTLQMGFSVQSDGDSALTARPSLPFVTPTSAPPSARKRVAQQTKRRIKQQDCLTSPLPRRDVRAQVTVLPTVERTVEPWWGASTNG